MVSRLIFFTFRYNFLVCFLVLWKWTKATIPLHYGPLRGLSNGRRRPQAALQNLRKKPLGNYRKLYRKENSNSSMSWRQKKVLNLIFNNFKEENTSRVTRWSFFSLHFEFNETLPFRKWWTLFVDVKVDTEKKVTALNKRSLGVRSFYSFLKNGPRL